MKNKTYTICLETLFAQLTGFDCYVDTKYGFIRKEIVDNKCYYDFTNGSLSDGCSTYEACLSGENCEVIKETKTYVLLQSVNKKIPFKLSREEFKVAAVETVS